MVQKKYRSILINIIEKHLVECKIYLFGSRAQGSHVRSSDIDIALDNQKEISSKILGLIKEEIEKSIIPYFVDVVDLHSVDDKMKEQILKHGVLWKS